MALGLATARAFAESLMVSTCTISRPSGEPVWDEETGTYAPPPVVVVYAGRCKLQDTGRAVANTEAGEREVAVTDKQLHLPVDGSGAVRRGDVARIDTNPLDPSVVGREFIVQAPHEGTAKTARRLPIEAVV